MLGNKNAVATIAVKNLKAVREFYEKTLELKLVPDEESGSCGVVAYKSGKSMIYVYESQFAGTNQATVVTWNVGGDIKPITEGLKKRGVKFERYDFPNVKYDGDVHVMGKIKAAWCKDPEGNILSLVNG